MQKRKIGSLQVSALGLGCMNISAGYGPADDSASQSMLQRAVECGYTFFDTATMYGHGHSEKMLGTALKDYRQQIVLASKCGLDANGINGKPETIIKQCEASLEKLQTDVIDLYYLHRMDPTVPIEDSIGALGKLVDQGKIREIGLSEVSTATLLKAIEEQPVAALQSEYSLWSRTPERGILDACNQHGVTFVPFSPLARAFLTGKSSDVTQLPPEDLRCSIARPRFEPDNFAHNAKLLIPFAEIARDNNCSMAQLALAWLLTIQKGSMVPIPGTRSSAHMEENAGAAEVTLDAATISALDNLINESTVKGERYNAARMADADSEKD